MEYELFSEVDFAGMPENPEQCFIEFESACRANMTRMLHGDESNHFERTIQLQYMHSVSSVAVECGILNLPGKPLLSDENFFEVFNEFSLAVQGEVARIRIRGRRGQDAFSVLLTTSTRTKIEHYISRLRDIIDSSDLPADRKNALGLKLDQLMAELGNRRLSFAKTMAILSVVLVGLNALSNATTIAADGSAAVTAIMKLIGVDKESEDKAAARLAPPPQKALPAPLAKTVIASQKAPDKAQTLDLDDDIAFNDSKRL